MRLRSAAAASVVLIALASGCGSESGSGDAAQTSTTSTTAPPVENFTQPATVEIEISGHQSARFEGETTINVLRVRSELGNNLTLGPKGAVSGGEWTINEAFLSLVKFRGDGKYTLEPRPPASGTQAMADNVYTVISHTSPGGKAEAYRYDTLVESCVAEVKRDGIEGSVRCDALKDAFGNVVSFHMTWKATGKPRDILKEAIDKAATTSTTPP